MSVNRKTTRQEAISAKVTHGSRRTDISWWPMGRIMGRVLQRAADLRGATPYMLVIRGDFELAEGRHREALRLYKQAARMSPQLPEPRLAIARAEIARGRPARARKALQRVLEIDPRNALASDMMEALPPAPEAGY